MIGGTRDIRVVGQDDDTLTESCEGAVKIMVIEMKVGSLQKLPFGD